MSKIKGKTRGANVPVPQSREDAASAVARYGALGREAKRIDLTLMDDVTALKEAAERKTQPIKDEMESIRTGLMMWAEVNRQQLTNNRIKTVDLGTGTLAWRMAGPKVKGVPARRDALAALIETIKAMGLTQFVRVSEEVNKEAMLSDPETAQKVPGIKIASDGESFEVTPFEVQSSSGGQS